MDAILLLYPPLFNMTLPGVYDVQVKAEVMAYLQANPEVVRKAYGLL